MTATAVPPSVPQLRLPGQAAAPEGPIDLAGMYLMHRAFRRDLGRFAAAVAATPGDDGATWRRLARRWTWFETALHHHHTGEDEGLWPLLRERGGDAGVLDAMAAEHERLDALLAQCRSGIAAGGAPGLVEAAAALHEALDAHLAHEETAALPMVQQLLTPADWERLDRDVFGTAYTPREALATVGWVAEGLSDADLRRMPGVPAAVLPAVAFLGRRLARADRRTFHAAPGVNGGLRPSDRIATAISGPVSRLHTALVRRIGIGKRFRGGDVLLLTVTGRRTGEPRTTPLLFLRDGEDYVVAASNGGIDREPQWWRNLQEDPRAVVEAGGRSVPVRAREVDGADRDALWDRLVDSLSAYAGYQEKVQRRIAVLRLTPRA